MWERVGSFFPSLQSSRRPDLNRKGTEIVTDYSVIMFDLDGTLLPMDQEQFTRAYFKELCRKICPYGYRPEALTEGIWKGTEAMVANDGEKTNKEVFWDAFSAVMGQEIRLLEGTLDSFYRNEFRALKTVTRENPNAAKAVAAAKKLGCIAVLATNSIFPLCAVETRLSWIGLAPGDFSYVTTYENFHSCKPNPRYYREILARLNVRPGGCLMIGNDVAEDIEACRTAGIQSFLVTDCLLDRGADLSDIRKGTFAELLNELSAEKG
ncbi:MAG: HAD family hydrolase [Synergistales bacterium]|nr:HAD family hydrolase [Synergistales bacterium]